MRLPMDGRRMIQLALLGVNLLLGLGVVASIVERYRADDFSLFLLVMLGAILGSLDRHCRTLPSVGSLAAVALLNLVAAAILVPNFTRHYCGCGGQLTACKSNVKNIATSLEMYSTDNAGHYPASLAQLTPNYLWKIPVCPSAQVDTYSLQYFQAVEPDAYTVACGGCYHHAGGIDAPNYPQYSSHSGLILP